MTYSQTNAMSLEAARSRMEPVRSGARHSVLPVRSLAIQPAPNAAAAIRTAIQRVTPAKVLLRAAAFCALTLAHGGVR